MADKPIIRIATHDGPSHSDDVLSTAILTTLFKDHQIIRSRDPDILDLCDYLIDVGGIYNHPSRKYDHHMQNPPSDVHNHILLS